MIRIGFMTAEEMFENVDDGWTMDAWVYYKLTYFPGKDPFLFVTGAPVKKSRMKTVASCIYRPSFFVKANTCIISINGTLVHRQKAKLSTRSG